MSTVSTALRADARVIGLVGLAHGISHFYQLVIPSLFPWIKAEFGLSYAQLGLITTVFYAVSGVFQALAGFAVDRFGTQRMLLCGLLLLAAGAGVAAVAPGYEVLLLAAALIGLGNSVFHPADFAVLNSRVAPARLGHAFSVHGLTGNLGYAAAPPLMFAIATAAGWQVALACASVAGLVMALLVWAMPTVFAAGTHLSGSAPGASAGGKAGAGKAGVSADKAATAGAAGASAPRLAWLNGAVLGFFAFFVCLTAVATGIQNFTPQVMGKLYGAAVGTAASALTLYLLAAAGGMVVGGFVATRVARQETVAAGSLVGAAALLAFAATGLPPLWAAVAVLGGVGFLMGVVGPLRDMLIRRVASSGTMGRVYGVVYSGIDVGGAMGPVLLGVFLDRGQPGVAWAILALSLVAGAAISVRVGGRVRARAAAA